MGIETNIKQSDGATGMSRFKIPRPVAPDPGEPRDRDTGRRSPPVGAKPLSPVFLAALSALVAATIFIVDLQVPMGVAGEIPYVVVVLVGWWYPKRRYIILVATVTSVLIVVGHVWSPEDEILWMALVHRLLVLFVIWVTAFLLFVAKTAMAKVRESEELLRTVIDTVPAIITVKDRNSRYLLTNRYHEEMFGYKRGQLLGKTPDFYSPEHGQKMKDMERTVMETGEVLPNYDYSLVDSEGRNHEVWGTKAPLPGLSGEIIGTVTVAMDVTDRNRAEEALQKNEERLHGAIESLQEGFALFDAEDRLVMINDVYRRINPKAQEFLDKGMRFEDLIRTNVAEGRVMEAIGREEAFIRERLEQHRHPKDPILRQFSDGKWYVLKETRTPEGGIVLTFTDITEIKQAEKVLSESEAIRRSEERLRTIFETSPVGIAIVSMKTNKRLYINPAMVKLFGASSVEQLLEHDLRTTYADPADLDWLRSKTGDDFITEAEIERVRLDGTKWWCLFNRRLIDFEGEEALLGWHYDISERKEAERKIKKINEELEQRVEERTQELGKSEALFRALVSHSPTKIHIKDVEGRYTLINKEAEKLYGVTEEEGRGKTSHDLFEKDVADAFTAHDRTIIESGEAMEEEEEFTLDDGVHTYLTIKFPIFDQEEITGIGSIGTDITERKQAEKIQLEIESRFRAVVDASPTPITLKDRDGRYLLANEAFAAWMGTDASKVVGLTIHDFLPEAQAADVEAEDRRLMESGEQTVEEATRSFPDGLDRTVLINRSPIRSSDGDIKAIATILTDITERKKAEEALRESEERFRSAFESVPLGNIVIRDTGIIEAFNPVAEAIFGYTADEIIGRNISMLMPKPDRNHHDDYIRRYIKTGTAKIIGIGREVTGLRKNGEKFPMHLDIGRIDTGDRPSFIGSITDLTETKALEKQLRQSRRVEALGQLTGGIAHDFNNLLAVINGNLELAVDSGGLEDETMEMLFRALAAVDKGALLTDQLLTFSRQQALEPKTIEANSLLFDTINLLMRTLGEDIDIKTAFETQIPLIEVDPGMLENAVLNMALNARDAMPRGGRLTIKTNRVDLDGEVHHGKPNPLVGPHVLISISDTGTGIKKKDLEHVFEPFFTTKGIGEGTGLGLSMVYGFVEQSGGHVTIESKRGEGTTINLYFPVAESLGSEKKEKSATGPKADAKGTETILVVEDEEDVRRVTVSILNRLGYQVMEAENGPSALKILDKGAKSVDLVFSDVVMPLGMSGFDLAKKLRRHYQDIKVLLTSGYPEKVNDKDGLDGTGIKLLRKPYKKTDLAQAVRGVLDQ